MPASRLSLFKRSAMKIIYSVSLKKKIHRHSSVHFHRRVTTEYILLPQWAKTQLTALSDQKYECMLAYVELSGVFPRALHALTFRAAANTSRIKDLCFAFVCALFILVFLLSCLSCFCSHIVCWWKRIRGTRECS